MDRKRKSKKISIFDVLNSRLFARKMASLLCCEIQTVDCCNLSKCRDKVFEMCDKFAYMFPDLLEDYDVKIISERKTDVIRVDFQFSGQSGCKSTIEISVPNVKLRL